MFRGIGGHNMSRNLLAWNRVPASFLASNPQNLRGGYSGGGSSAPNTSADIGAELELPGPGNGNGPPTPGEPPQKPDKDKPEKPDKPDKPGKPQK